MSRTIEIGTWNSWGDNMTYGTFQVEDGVDLNQLWRIYAETNEAEAYNETKFCAWLADQTGVTQLDIDCFELLDLAKGKA